VHPVVVTLGAYAWRLVAIAAVVVGAIWLLGEIKVVVVPVLVAILLTRVLEPVASKLRARGARPGLAAASALLGFFALVALVVWLIGPSVLDEFENLGPTLTEAVDDVEAWLVEDAPVEISRADIDRAREMFVDRVSEMARSPDGGFTGAASLLVEIPTGGVLALFLTFFMLKDGGRFTAWVRRQLPEPRRELADVLGRRSWRSLGGFLRGAALLGLVEGIAIGVTVWLVGGELVAPIVVVTFAAAFVPILGAIVAGVIAVLVTLVTSGLAQALVVAAVAIVVQQLDNDLLAPVVYGRMLSIHPVAILVGVVAGGALFGILGTLFAVPVLVVAIGVLEDLHHHRSEAAVLPEGASGEER